MQDKEQQCNVPTCTLVLYSLKYKIVENTQKFILHAQYNSKVISYVDFVTPNSLDKNKL